MSNMKNSNIMIILIHMWLLFDASFSPGVPQMTIIPLNYTGVCNNLEAASSIINDGSLNECLSLCESLPKCNNFNYFTHLKHTDDSRCYLFNQTDNCILKSLDPQNGMYEDNQSFIYYKQMSDTCIDYPSEWKDSTMDNCATYSTYFWCTNDYPDLFAHSFADFDYFRSNLYGTSALESCCNCDGGIYYMDTIYWTPYYSEDQNVTKDIICSPHGNLGFSSVEWDEYTAYQLCLKYNHVFLTSTLTQNMTIDDYNNKDLTAPCEIFIDINFESDDFDD
eukprot:286790_1